MGKETIPVLYLHSNGKLLIEINEEKEAKFVVPRLRLRNSFRFAQRNPLRIHHHHLFRYIVIANGFFIVAIKSLEEIEVLP